jgi:membrane protease YdiL (CAAX protease family)
MLLIYFTFFFPGLFAGPPDPAFLDNYIILYCVYTLPWAALLIYVVWLKQPSDLNALGIFNLNTGHVPILLLAFAAVLLLNQVFYVFISLLPQEMIDEISNAYSWEILKPIPVWLILLFALITGYWEELFFRAYLLTRFEQLQIPLRYSLILSALVFMMGHLYMGFMGLLIAAVMGTGLCLLFLKTKSLHVIALTHAFYNFMVLFAAQAQFYN